MLTDPMRSYTDYHRELHGVPDWPLGYGKWRPVRYHRGDAWATIGHAWPYERDGRAVKTQDVIAASSYLSKYVLGLPGLRTPISRGFGLRRCDALLASGVSVGCVARLTDLSTALVARRYASKFVRPLPPESQDRLLAGMSVGFSLFEFADAVRVHSRTAVGDFRAYARRLAPRAYAYRRFASHSQLVSLVESRFSEVRNAHKEDLW